MVCLIEVSSQAYGVHLGMFGMLEGVRGRSTAKRRAQVGHHGTCAARCGLVQN